MGTVSSAGHWHGLYLKSALQTSQNLSFSLVRDSSYIAPPFQHLHGPSVVEAAAHRQASAEHKFQQQNQQQDVVQVHVNPTFESYSSGIPLAWAHAPPIGIRTFCK